MYICLVRSIVFSDLYFFSSKSLCLGDHLKWEWIPSYSLNENPAAHGSTLNYANSSPWLAFKWFLPGMSMVNSLVHFFKSPFKSSFALRGELFHCTLERIRSDFFKDLIPLIFHSAVSSACPIWSFLPCFPVVSALIHPLLSQTGAVDFLTILLVPLLASLESILHTAFRMNWDENVMLLPCCNYWRVPPHCLEFDL